MISMSLSMNDRLILIRTLLAYMASNVLFQIGILTNDCLQTLITKYIKKIRVLPMGLVISTKIASQLSSFVLFHSIID